jgi:hypothetical protein
MCNGIASPFVIATQNKTVSIVQYGALKSALCKGFCWVEMVCSAGDEAFMASYKVLSF